jgi:hypothetical protein
MSYTVVDSYNTVIQMYHFVHCTIIQSGSFKFQYIASDDNS